MLHADHIVTHFSFSKIKMDPFRVNHQMISVKSVLGYFRFSSNRRLGDTNFICDFMPKHPIGQSAATMIGLQLAQRGASEQSCI